LSDIINDQVKSTEPPVYGPYPNKSSFQLGEWFWNHGIQKSQASFQELVSIVGDRDFRPEHIQDTNWRKINNQLARGGEMEWVDEDAEWSTSSVTISTPFHRLTSHPGPQSYTVAKFHHRSLVAIIQNKLRNTKHGPHFHYDPYELLWQPHNNNQQQPMHVHGELYTSTAFREAHQALQNSPPEPGCNLPRVIVALMFWSDSTHLTNFGDTKLWPLYLFFGNESKYRRGKPSSNLCEHVAYFERVCILSYYLILSFFIHSQLPDAFKDFATKYTGTKTLKSEFMAHCHRELTHAQWEILLDDDFVAAYEHGMVVACYDDMLCRFYPRIFIYSTDYPEK
jgi:hypothetical protein